MTCPDSPNNGEGDSLEVPIIRLAFAIAYGVMAALALCFICCFRWPLNRLFNRYLPDFDNRLVRPVLKTIAFAATVILWPLGLIVLCISLCIR